MFIANITAAAHALMLENSALKMKIEELESNFSSGEFDPDFVRELRSRTDEIAMLRNELHSVLQSYSALVSTST